MVNESITGTRGAFVEQLGDGEERGLGIERVKHGFDQQHVRAAFEQARAPARNRPATN